MLVGVCFYQRESLPGYSAIFRHPNDELNFCYYLIPCGKDGYCGDVKVNLANAKYACNTTHRNIDTQRIWLLELKNILATPVECLYSVRRHPWNDITMMIIADSNLPG